ncbi:MAG: hypothetical protein ACP5O0_09045 [Acidimicrobiales bacterium]
MGIHQEPPVSFIGTFTLGPDSVEAAAQMNTVLSLEPGDPGATWTEAFRRLIEEVEDDDVLVMVSSIVGSDSHLQLDPQEF